MTPPASERATYNLARAIDETNKAMSGSKEKKEEKSLRICFVSYVVSRIFVDGENSKSHSNIQVWKARRASFSIELFCVADLDAEWYSLVRSRTYQTATRKS